MNLLSGAEPFLLRGNGNGVLLLHGFSGSPAEMRLMGGHLHAAGFTVFATRLPGHGTEVRDLARSNWMDWYGAALDGWHILRSFCEQVHVVGLSMGALLALKLASERPVGKLVSLGAPIYLFDKRIAFLSLYRIFLRYAPKKIRVYEAGSEYVVGYDKLPLSSLASLLDLIGSVKRDLAKIQCPTLIMHARRERTVRPESAEYIFDQLTTSAKKLIWLEKSGHIMTVDIERALVFQAVTDLLREGKLLP